MKSHRATENLYIRFLAAGLAVGFVIGIGYFVRRQTTVPVVITPAAKVVSSVKTATKANQPTTKMTPTTTPAPKQITVYAAEGKPVATFTIGARTVLMHGPERTFTDPDSTTVTIKTTDWVRVYPSIFTGTVDQAWVNDMVAQNNNQSSPDLIQIAMQYVSKAPKVKDGSGLVIAGDASYGPLQTGGTRQEGSDFNDYLGVAHSYGTVVDKAEPAQSGSLDCSGYQRMIWGYRSGLPLEQDPTGAAIPRRAYQILNSAPGIVVMADANQQITDFSRLQAGDIVFHDASTSDGTQIDHLGMYLGVDSLGKHRFISSRKTANGPTFGDVGGKSVLDGNGLYAKTFRAIRRF
jgi:hypothetical protein